VAQLGVNAHGEVLVPGRVPDCYLGLLLDPPGDQRAGRVLVLAPAALRHPAVPQPDGTVLYELVTGHPDRQPQTPGARSGSTRRRPPGRWSPAGSAATCWAGGWAG